MSALRRVFNLARKEGKLHEVPYFPFLEESAPRSGFVERADYERLSGHKTRAVFDRYNIVSENDLVKAGRQLESYFAKNGDNSGTALHQNAADRSPVN